MSASAGPIERARARAAHSPPNPAPTTTMRGRAGPPAMGVTRGDLASRDRDRRIHLALPLGETAAQALRRAAQGLPALGRIQAAVARPAVEDDGPAFRNLVLAVEQLGERDVQRALGLEVAH